MKLIFICAALLMPSVALSSVVKPLSIECGDVYYQIFSGVDAIAVTRNGELMSSPKFSNKPYGDDENSGIIEFDHWGENGGSHNHYTMVLGGGLKSSQLTYAPLDADGTQRGPSKSTRCTISMQK